MVPLGFLSLISAAVALPGIVPTVQLDYAKVVGSSLLGVDSYKGIPFAQPPVGNLRLRPPQSINSNLGTVFAVGVPRGCPQLGPSLNTTFLPPSTSSLVNQVLTTIGTVTGSSEDCLNLNVQVPAGTKPGAKLPVLFWIYGGGFEFGSTQIYDGSTLILNSIAQGKPIIFVAVNYRLSAYGFLGGKELAAEGSTNLGLLDQRKALEWVADNIEKFGGDSSKVTIWGESAGSISVLDQMVAKSGDNTYKGKPLFRGAIMNSGSVVPANPVDGVKGQAVYDQVVKGAGCAGSSDTLACLRKVDSATFLSASNSLPTIFSYQSLALSYLPRPDGRFLVHSPEQEVIAGNIAKVPFIVGDQEDEGTLFGLLTANITTQSQIVDYLKQYYFIDATKDQLTQLVTSYPDNQADGSPFRTGPLNAISPQFKRVAALLGDLTFTLTRRVFLEVSAAVSPAVPSWSFLSTAFYGTPVLGTFHANDVLTTFGILPGPVATTYQGYYLAFVNDLDPNKNAIGLTNWPQWKTARQLVQINALNNKVITDDFRTPQYNVIKELSQVLVI